MVMFNRDPVKSLHNNLILDVGEHIQFLGLLLIKGSGFDALFDTKNLYGRV